MATLLTDMEERLAALPTAEQASRRELLGRVAGLVIDKPLEEVASLVDQISAGHGDAGTDRELDRAWSLGEARKRNLERLLEDQARLVSECIPARTLREGMNVSRQRLHQLVADDRLVAIQLQEGSPGLFPFWQFASGVPVQPVTDLPRVIEAARQAGMGPVALHFFMVEPNDRVDGRPPYELLADGNVDRIVSLLGSVGLGPL